MSLSQTLPIEEGLPQHMNERVARTVEHRLKRPG
jgi:hypothetical protein